MTAKNTLLRASLFTLVTILLILAAVFLVRTNNENIRAQQQAASPGNTQGALGENFPIRDFQLPVVQDDQPPLLTEFGDFQCPHCARFAVALMPEIQRELVDTRTVRFEYRHYPFLGPESFLAAEASECARDQGQFQQYHDQLYRSIITRRIQAVTPESLVETARLLSLDLSEFQACTQSRVHEERVKQDKVYGRSLGVQGTPALFIDGEPIRWDSYQDLKDQIAAHIASTRGDDR